LWWVEACAKCLSGRSSGGGVGRVWGSYRYRLEFRQIGQ
jgi:hypothetical protein